MADAMYWLVTAAVVAMATGAPMPNKEELITASADSTAEKGGEMRMFAKRAEEMLYYGNQQNEPRVPMKKSDTSLINAVLHPPTPLGEVDEGGTIVAHHEIPVEEDLNARAEAAIGQSEDAGVAEALEIAKEQVKGESDGALTSENVGGEEEEEEEEEEKEGAETSQGGGDVTDENIVNAVGEENQSAEDGAGAAAVVDSPVSGQSDDPSDSVPVMDAGDEADDGNQGGDASETNSIEDDDDSGSNEADVQEFLDELRKESEGSSDDGGDSGVGDDRSNGMKNYQMVGGPDGVDPNYYQTMYHILDEYRRGLPDYYHNMLIPYYRRRRSLASIRRRNSHVRRIKRDLPSDWLAAYRGIDLPLSEDMKDSLLDDDDEESYSREDLDDELSRYIYGNLLNKIANSYDGLGQADVEEEIPYEEILPYELGSDGQESALEEYDPEESEYDRQVPSVYRENPYDDYIPRTEYRKRSGGPSYLSDLRRKRYFYPVYDEPETHWGAFVPEKRSYDDAIQRLQRLALALSDTPRPYYDNLLREYRKK